MRIIISENKIEQLKDLAQGFIDSEFNHLRNIADEEWGLGEFDEINEVESVDKIVVDDIDTTNGINIYVNLYIKTDREDFDEIIIPMIEYSIEQWIPNAKVHINTIYV
jgi:hypothetical protein